MDQYVVLYHEMPTDDPRPSHWDLMLEDDGHLATWELKSCLQDTTIQRANRLPDHRVEYLTYQGPISGNRGSVSQWDRGRYERLRRSPDLWQIRLQGKKLRGLLELRQQEEHWSVSFRAMD